MIFRFVFVSVLVFILLIACNKEDESGLPVIPERSENTDISCDIEKRAGE